QAVRDGGAGGAAARARAARPRQRGAARLRRPLARPPHPGGRTRRADRRADRPRERAAGAAAAPSARGRAAGPGDRGDLGGGRGAERGRPLRHPPAPQARGAAAHPHGARRGVHAAGMRPRTLTGRLTAAAVLAVVVAVACLAVSAQLLVAHQLRSSLDASLRSRAVDVARLSVSAPAPLTAPGALEAPVGGRQLSVEVLDRRGRFVARSLTLGAKLLPASAVSTRALRQGRSGFADVALGG